MTGPANKPEILNAERTRPNIKGSELNVVCKYSHTVGKITATKYNEKILKMYFLDK